MSGHQASRTAFRCVQMVICAGGILLNGCVARQPEVINQETMDFPRLQQLDTLSHINYMAPRVSLIQHHLTDDPEKLHQHEARLVASLGRAITRVAVAAGYEVSEFHPANRQQTFYHYQIAETVQRIIGKTANPNVAAGDLPSVGPTVNQLMIDELDSALLITYFGGYLKSTGQRRKERIASRLYWLLSLGRFGPQAPPPTNGDLLMVLLNANSGDILWKGSGSGPPDQMDELVERLFDQLPQPAR